MYKEPMLSTEIGNRIKHDFDFGLELCSVFKQWKRENKQGKTQGLAIPHMACLRSASGLFIIAYQHDTGQIKISIDYSIKLPQRKSPS